MNLSLIEMGLVLFVFMILIGIVSYVLGKRKTNTPIRAALLGFVFSFVPILGIIYIVYLIGKEDLVAS